MRWVWRAEAGGFKVEYAAVVLLVATLVTAVFAFGLPTDVKILYAEGICRIMPDSQGCDGEGEGGDQNGGTGEEDGDTDQDGTTPGEEDGQDQGPDPSASPSAPPEGDGEDEEPDSTQVLYDPELAGDLEDAEQELSDAESALAGAESDQVYDELMNLLGDIVGYNDAKACLTEGDIVACLWTIVGFTPWGKGAKLVKNAPKIIKLWNRWRKAKKTKEGLEKAVDTAKGKVDDALNACGISKKGNSFVAGTPVLLADGGTLPIEDVDVGDPVHSFDPRTGEEGARPVTAVIEGDGPKSLVDVTVTGPGGETGELTATAEHPFWAPEEARWIDAGDLTVGTPIRTSSGDWAQVTGLHTHQAEDRQVYNLTVDGLHTYHVLAGGTSLLVHNDDPRNRCGDAAEAANVSLNKLKDKQLKKILEKYETDPHEFKEDYVGKGAISKFDVAKGDDGFLWLVSKDGKTTIKTYEKW